MKNNYYFIYSFSNIYKKPSQLSEVTSQIIYGEKFKILSKNKNWLKIKTSSDNYIVIDDNKNTADNVCEECKKEDESVLQNLIMYSYKICNSCNLSKKIFPI